MQFDGYQDLTRIGRGGFATVYRARQVRLDRWVAIKVLSADFDDEHDVRRFESEAKALGRLSLHRNVADVYDAGITPEGRPFIVMRLYEKGSLADRIADGVGLPLAGVAAMGQALATALQAAHDCGIIHRDVKPGNVLLDANDEVALGDFGIAAMVDPDGRITTSVAFSAAYAAPEVLDHNAFSQASDQYSLAATLYAALAGAPPFPADTLARQILAVLQDPPAPLQRPDIPARLWHVLLRGLSKDPQDRFASVADFGVQLRTAVEQAADVPPVSEVPAPTKPAATPKPTQTLWWPSVSPREPGRESYQLFPAPIELGDQTVVRPRHPSKAPLSLPHDRASGPSSNLQLLVAEIDCGGCLYDVVAVPGTSLAYVSMLGDGGVAVVDIANRRVQTRIDVGTDACALAASPDGAVIYVSNPRDATVTAIDAFHHRVKGRLPTGTGTHGLAMDHDGRLLYASRPSEADVLALATATGQHVKYMAARITTEELWSVAVAPSGNNLYVAAFADDEVHAFDLRRDCAARRIAVRGGPTDIAVSPAGRVFVTCYVDDLVCVVEPRNKRHTMLGVVDVDAAPVAISLSADGDLAYVACEQGESICVLDSTSLLLVDSIPLAKRPTALTVASGGTELLVASDQDSKLSVIAAS